MFTDVVSVPCSILSTLDLQTLGEEFFTVSSEEEAIGIACGLAVGGRSPLVAIQNSGFARSLNVLGSLSIAYEIPVTLLVSLRGGEGERNATQVPFGLATAAFHEALFIPFVTVRDAADLFPALEQCQSVAVARSGPASLIYDPWSI